MACSLSDVSYLALRNAIEDVILRYADDAGLLSQPVKIAQLAQQYPHSIHLLSATTPGPAAERFNCHTYALGMHESAEVRRHWTRLVFPNADFMHHLIESLLVEIEEPNDGTLVIYFGHGAAKRSGQWWSGRLHSKWGNGHIWDHALHEVPIPYGDAVRFFRAPSRADAIGAYVAFAQSIDPSLRPADPPGGAR